jgi:hypothetical protein
VTLAVPIRLLEGQLFADACVSEQSWTVGISPTIPAGSVALTSDMYCCPSGLLNPSVKLGLEPAFVVEACALWPTRNPGWQAPAVTSNGLAGLAGACPL